MRCSGCDKEADFRFRVLEVQTLHIRSLKGENRVQALGKLQDYGICRKCAEERLREMLGFSSDRMKHLMFSAAVILAACFILASPDKGDLTEFTGLFFLLAGILISYGTVSRWLRLKRELSGLSPEKQLERAAWEKFLAAAPRKSIDSDLSYIPVDGETLKMKKGDFMVMYDLIPEMVEAAWSAVSEDYKKGR